MSMPSRDLFDDSTMSFGDHLEALRFHLWKAIVGVAICVVITLIYGDVIIGIMRQPIDAALRTHGIEATDDLGGGDYDFSQWWDETSNWFTDWWNGIEPEPEVEPIEDEPLDREALRKLRVKVEAFEVAGALHKVAPETYPEPNNKLRDDRLSLTLEADLFAEMREAIEQMHRPVTLNVQEAFMTYLKVSGIAGLVLASPWVFYQIWQFVAAGLYRHERRFVYLYGILSLSLFVIGIIFCFKLVIPFVLKFLLGFNHKLKINPQIRLSEWISFVILLPLMFGVSFQLPMVMKFLQSISLFSEETYREKRRMAILVIAALSMFLTPADPMSMILMMCPLIVLYEFGIWLCGFGNKQNPFADAV